MNSPSRIAAQATGNPAGIPSELLALQRLYHWEKATPDRIALTQPMGAGAVQRNYLAACARDGEEYALPQVRPRAGFTH